MEWGGIVERGRGCGMGGANVTWGGMGCEIILRERMIASFGLIDGTLFFERRKEQFTALLIASFGLIGRYVGFF